MDLKSSIHAAFESGNVKGLKHLVNKMDINNSTNFISFDFNININQESKIESQELKKIMDKLLKEGAFHNLEKKFLNYIKNNLKEIYFPNYYRVNYLSVKDKFLNNPIHLACQNSKYKILDFLEEFKVENIHNYLNENNSLGISGYLLIKENSIKNVKMS
jgi:hypothetical protein